MGDSYHNPVDLIRNHRLETCSASSVDDEAKDDMGENPTAPQPQGEPTPHDTSSLPELEPVQGLADIGHMEDVPGDGNCGYHALMKALQAEALIEDGSYTVTRFRRMLHQYAETCQDYFCGTAVQRKTVVEGQEGYWSHYKSGCTQNGRRPRTGRVSRAKFRSHVLEAIWSEGVDFDHGARKKYWFGGQVILPIAAMRFQRTFVMYGNHEGKQPYTELYQYEHGKVHITTRQGVWVRPPARSLCLVHTNSNHYQYLRTEAAAVPSERPGANTDANPSASSPFGTLPATRWTTIETAQLQSVIRVDMASNRTIRSIDWQDQTRRDHSRLLRAALAGTLPDNIRLAFNHREILKWTAQSTRRGGSRASHTFLVWWDGDCVREDRQCVAQFKAGITEQEIHQLGRKSKPRIELGIRFTKAKPGKSRAPRAKRKRPSPDEWKADDPTLRAQLQEIFDRKGLATPNSQHNDVNRHAIGRGNKFLTYTPFRTWMANERNPDSPLLQSDIDTVRSYITTESARDDDNEPTATETDK